MTLSLTLTASVVGSFLGANDVADLKQEFAVRERTRLAHGTGADQADMVFADQRILAASASETLDLAAGLTDAFGTALTFVEVVAILVKAAAGNTHDVVLGGAAANAWVGPFGAATETLKVRPGGTALLVAPDAAGLGTVAPGTGDLLKVANSGGASSVTYEIIIIGRSA